MARANGLLDGGEEDLWSEVDRWGRGEPRDQRRESESREEAGALGDLEMPQKSWCVGGYRDAPSLGP